MMASNEPPSALRAPRFPGTDRIYSAAVFIEPPDWGRWWTRKQQLEHLPTPALFWANLKVLLESDYPLVTGLHPVMSKKMLGVLEAVGEFEHEVKPTRMLQHPEWRRRAQSPWANEPVPPIGDAEPAEESGEYVVVLTPPLDIANRERSTIAPDEPFLVEGLPVLDEPAGGFPPFFTVLGDALYYYVSGEAQRRLVEEGVCVSFRHVEVVWR